MKKCIMYGLVIVMVFVSSFGIVKAFNNAYNDQFTTYPNSIMTTAPSSLLFQNTFNNTAAEVKVNMDSTANVPKGAFVAHVITDKSTIDVQRFVDITAHVACYYSENAGNVISVNCVPLN